MITAILKITVVVIIITMNGAIKITAKERQYASS